MNATLPVHLIFPHLKQRQATRAAAGGQDMNAMLKRLSYPRLGTGRAEDRLADQQRLQSRSAIDHPDFQLGLWRMG